MPPHRQPAHILAAPFVFVYVIAAAAAISWKRRRRRRRPPVPYHTSKMSGEEWVQELIAGHPNRIKTELGMSVYVFKKLITVLKTCGLCRSKHLSCEEQVAIFLYAAVTGLSSTRHLGERFQHSNDTISKYVLSILLPLCRLLAHCPFVAI